MTGETIFLISLAAGLVLVCIGIWLHHLFEGECLPLDLWREWKLARTPLQELDDNWRETPERSGIIVSLTTIPSRIEGIDDTLKSLLDQSRKPASIILNVPQYSYRERTPYVVPDRLRCLASLEIRRCEDWGPATKVIPALLTEPPDTPILVVDDDRIYPPRMIARLETMSAALPHAALTLAGWIVPRDLTDRATTLKSNLLMQPPAPVRASRLKKPKPVDVLLGVMGYLVRPRFFDMTAMTDFSDGPAALRLVDDVRTSALCKAEKYVIPAPRLSFIPKRRWSLYKNTALGRINRGEGGDERRHTTLAIRHYAGCWRVGGRTRA